MFLSAARRGRGPALARHIPGVISSHAVLGALALVATASFAAGPTPQRSPASPTKLDSALLLARHNAHSGRTEAARVASARGASVSVRFAHVLSIEEIASLDARGFSFERIDGEPAHIGPIYALRVPWDGLEALAQRPDVRRIESGWRPAVHPTLDVARDLVGTSTAWRFPSAGQLDGSGVTIASVDTGVDVFQPAFWYADGDTLAWLDVNGTGAFEGGMDTVDLDSDGVADSDETLTFWDAPIDDLFDQLQARAGVFEPDFDWLYADINGNGRRDFGVEAGFTEADPTFGEPLFITVDRDGDNILDVGEPLVALRTSKVRATFETNLIERRRGRDLIFQRFDKYVTHGTNTSGILLGEVPGRRLAGVAPGAELLMIRRRVDQFRLPPEIYLPWARARGADIIMYEFGSWVFEFLDGSSNLEQMLDQLAREGIVQIAATGNLAGPTRRRHFRVALPPQEPITVRFEVPERIEAHRVFFSVLWREPSVNLAFSLLTPDGQIAFLPGDGSHEALDDVAVFSNRDVSERGTVKMDVQILGRTALSGEWTLSLANPSRSSVRADGYLTDDETVWQNGAYWLDFLTDDGTVTSPGTADEAITVGAFDPRGSKRSARGDLNDFSGWGLRIDGRQVVDIIAPGSVTYSTSPRSGDPPTWGYEDFNGTSASEPFVAGAAALLLQADPALTHNDIRRLLHEGALADRLTGEVPNNRWGQGKLSISGALAALDPPRELPPAIAGVEVIVNAREVIVRALAEGAVARLEVRAAVGEGDFSAVAMTQVAQGRYEASIAAPAPGPDLRYYVVATGADGSTVTDPIRAPLETHRVERGGETPRFIEATAGSGLEDSRGALALAPADFDNDGIADLASVGNGIRLFRGQGNGTFSDETTRLGPPVDGAWSAVAWTDFDGDGFIDLVAAGRNGVLGLWCSRMKESFEWVEDGAGLVGVEAPRALAPADADGDGWVDLYLVNGEGPSSFFRNKLGRFTNETRRRQIVERPGASTWAAWADYDRDGDPDLYVVKSPNRDLLFRNDGTRFMLSTGAVGIRAAGPGRAAAWSDFNEDGLPDVYVGNFAAPSRLWISDTEGTLSDIGDRVGVSTVGPTVGLAVGDLDNEGRTDLVALEAGLPPLVFINTGTLLTNVSTEAGPLAWTPLRSVAFLDADRDGRLDLVSIDEDGRLRLFLNQSPPLNWLDVRLVGRSPNWFGVGSTVTVRAEGERRVRDVGLGEAPASLPLHLGLGATSVVDTLEVRWPQGTVQRLTDIGAGRMITVIEGSAVDVALDQFVWPGDTNDDGQVDASDVLPLGRFWGMTGPARHVSSVAWRAQAAQTWPERGASFADANGDGWVDELDIEAIVANWRRARGVVADAAPESAAASRRALLAALRALPQAEWVRRVVGHLMGRPRILLAAPHPNPFNAAVTVELVVRGAVDARVQAEIVNTLGQRVRELLEGSLSPGRHTLRWDGRDGKGRAAASGVYIVRVQAKDGERALRRVVLAR